MKKDMVRAKNVGLDINFGVDIENAIVAAGEATQSARNAADGLVLPPEVVERFIQKYRDDPDAASIVRVVQSARVMGYDEGFMAATRVFGAAFGFRFEEPQDGQKRLLTGGFEV